mgnify:FL=1
MKIAVPARDGHVDDHFGHCAAYEIFEIDDNRRIVSTDSLPAPGGCGCKSGIAVVLRNMGVGVMLAGNMGQGAVGKLAENGIEVIRGCSGKTADVVARYLAGGLTDNARVCDHHDCHHHYE